MAPVSFIFPTKLDAANALGLRKKLDRLPESDEYVFDFGLLGHTEPFGMLFASSVVREFLEQRGAAITGINFDRCGYQGHMGFFRALGIEHGNHPGDAVGGVNYLPITMLSVDELRAEAARSCQYVGVAISDHAARMSGLLTRTDGGEVHETLAYSLQEIMRNVVEHSGASAVQYCLQHWPSKYRVHLAILDTGMGVLRSLCANPYLDFATDLDALKLCLMPGVSGKMYRGKRRDPNDIWENSGYGLYMTSRLSSEVGSFAIFSGANGLIVGDNHVFDVPCSFNGTAIRVSLDTRHIDSLSRKLRQFQTEGLEAAKMFSGADTRGASGASLMLRTQFRG